MSLRRVMVLIVSSLALHVAAQDPGSAKLAVADPALEARVMAIGAELRCLVCQNETVAASNAELAVDLRGQIREQLRDGRSEVDILAFMSQRYGDFVLYRPPLKTSTVLLWLGPFMLLLLGGFALVRHLQRRAAGSLEAGEGSDLPAEHATAISGGAYSARQLTLGALVLAVPALALYSVLGQPASILQPAHAAPTLADVDGMVRQMEQALRARPAGNAADAPAWDMLARAQASLQRYAQAAESYARAIELDPDDAQRLADRADLLRLINGPGGSAEAERLVQRALAIDPRHPKALALAAAQAPAATSTTGISGRVEIAPELRSRLQPGDTLYITARTPQGPRLPLAVLRLSASEEPVAFKLSDDQAMAPDHRISDHAQVVVEARISRSGDAMPKAGDLVGRTGAIANTEQGLRVLVAGVVP
ncbi:MAG: cytochrome c-type biogenesis protein CcmH [Hydrogenophaga sp.]|uniref:cytochrome c-type biogenesis protein CcmH n=1 Tax=Hydrogenophaga sp. TaxID=1904254 RepID=UPI003D10FCEC